MHTWHLLLMRFWRRGRLGVALLSLVCLFVCLPAHAGSFVVSAGYAPYPSPFASWRIAALDNSFSCTSSAAAGWSISVDASSSQAGTHYTVYAPTTVAADTYQLTSGSFQTSFAVTPPSVPPPSVSSSPCVSSYPSNVSMYLADAPQPCAYFAATQGFNASSAPIILAVLSVLVVILAIWLGHDSIMSLFRRLVTSMTGGG